VVGLVVVVFCLEGRRPGKEGRREGRKEGAREGERERGVTSLEVDGRVLDERGLNHHPI